APSSPSHSSRRQPRPSSDPTPERLREPWPSKVPPRVRLIVPRAVNPGNLPFRFVHGFGCMSAFAGYAHGSKSSIGDPGDSVLECGGRGALENGVPSREGQIMDGTTIELTEKLERLLREAAQVSVDLDRAKGTIVGVPHYSVIEARAHELGQQLSRQIQLRRMGEISAQASSSAKCPACGTRCELGRKKRRVTSIDGPLVVEEPVGHCPRWSSGLFPPSGKPWDLTLVKKRRCSCSG